jgi:hypothetical protein
MNTPMKRCYKCKQELPATLDYFSKKNDGLASLCKECAKIEAKKYYRKYKETDPDSLREKGNERKRKWRKENPEKYTAERQRHMANNLEKERERCRLYRRKKYQESPDEVRAKNRQWAKENPISVHERNQRFRANNPQYSKIKNAKRKARKQSLPDNFTAQDWQRALDYFNDCCAVCGCPAGLWHTIAADHWIPLTSPNCPGTIPTNIIPLCHAQKDGEGGCNNSKYNREPEQWLTEKYGKRKAQQVLDRINTYFEYIRTREQ